jgi:uncharacterized protein YecT (DUF1311 family)
MKAQMSLAICLVLFPASYASADECSSEQKQNTQVECLSRRVQVLEKQVEVLTAERKQIEETLDAKIRAAGIPSMDKRDNLKPEMTD